MKIFLLDTSLPINSRNMKIVQSLSKAFPHAEIHQIVWDRAGNNLKIENPFVHVYNKFSPLGALWTKAKNLCGYRLFVRKLIKEYRPDVVIASHWDTLVIAPRLNNWQYKLIYENLDIPTGIFRPVFKIIERKALRHTDLIIHASRFFKDLYPQSIRQIVLENKPFFEIENKIKYALHRPLRITYIGNIRYKEILFNLIDAIKEDKRFRLTLHGGGAEYDDVKRYSEGISNVEMTGSYDYQNIAKVYTDVDVIWAVYPSKDFNVKYAISNKFFESVYLGIPCVFAQDTMLGDYAIRNGIGMVVNPYNSDNIRKLFVKIVDGGIDLIQIANNLGVMRSQQTSWDKDFEQVIEFIKG